MAASPPLSHHHFQDLDPESPLSPRKNPCKFFRNFFVVILVLAVLPLFPSQAPEFISQTSFTKMCELLYLLFIGIVVCYGLFSRTAVKVNNEACHNLGNVKPQIWSPLNGISQISSIFENGFENSCGFDELRIPQVFSPFPKGLYPNGGAFVNNGSGNRRSSVVNGGFGNFSGSNGKQASRGLNLQYFVAESMLLDQIGKPKSSIEYNPLGLPVRSLRSRNLDSDRLESSNVRESSVRFKGSCNVGEKVESGVRGLIPTNLEGKFKDEVVAPSPIPWRSRSSRVEMKPEMGSIKFTLHFRPTSGEGFEFEPFKSQSFWSSIPSHASSKHSLSGVPSFVSIPVELPKPKMEDLKGKEKFDGTKAPILQSKLAPLSGDSLTRSSNSRHLSIGSTSKMNVQIGSKDEKTDFRKSKKGEMLNAMMQELKGKEKFNGPKQKQPSLKLVNGDASFKNSYSRSLSMRNSEEVKVNGVENYLKDFLEKKEDDNVLGAEKNIIDFSKMSKKPTDLVNGFTPGKSVRTIRSSEKVIDTKETMAFPSSIDNMFDMKLEIMPKDTRKGNLDDVKEIKFERVQSSDKEEETESDVFSDAEPHSGEVDKRADEFIAKFKEQIRLQKVASRRLNFS